MVKSIRELISDEKIVEKLEEVGLTDPMVLAVTEPNELASILEISETKAKKIINEIKEKIGLEFETADKVLERKMKMKKISTGCKALDELLGGGIPTQAITEAYGPFGSGKTQLGFQLAVNVQLPEEKGGLGRNCLFIDSEGTFSPERIAQIAKAKGLDVEKTLKNIFVTRAYNSEHQMLIVEKAAEIIPEKNIGLIIVDSVTSHFRADYVGRGELAERQQKLNKHLHQLQRLADMFNLAVYITNQVMARPDVLFGDPTTPIGGHVLAHICVSPDTLVITNEGIKEIKDVHNPLTIYSFNNDFGFNKIIEKGESKKNVVIRINNNLEASEEHKIYIFTENGFKEVMAKDIKKGDYLILPAKIDVEVKKFEIPDFELEKVAIIKNAKEVKEKLRRIFRIKRDEECLKYLGIRARHLRRILNQNYPTSLKVIEKIKKLVGNVKFEIVNTNKHKNVKKVKELSKELAQILGYYIGDGSTDFLNNSIRIKDKEKEVLKYYNNLFYKVFGIKGKIIKVRNKNCYELKFANSYVSKVLRYLIENVEKIFFEDEEKIKSFIRGIFDAEGSVGSSIVLALKNKKLIVLLKLLLLRLGIHSKIHKLRKKYYRLTICGTKESYQKFKEIGFTSKRKNERLMKKIGKEVKIPIKREKIKNILKSLGINIKFEHPENKISLKELIEIKNKYPILQKVFGNIEKLRFEKVYSLDKIKINKPLIDIETSCCNFIANGYLVHNSFIRIYLRKSKQNLRIAKLIDAPHLPEREVVFQITENGIEDVK